MAKQQPKIHITIVHPCMVGEKPVAAGKSYHAEEKEARDLFAAGKAKPVEKLTTEDKAIIDAHQASLKRGSPKPPSAPPASKKDTGGDGGDAGGGDETGNDQLTKKEIKAELDRLKVSYSSRDSLEELQEKLDTALATQS